MQAYISCPLGEDSKKITQVAAKLNVMGYQSWWYERGATYDDQKLRLSEMFVLISSGNQFDFNRSGMTMGCKGELDQAEKLGKRLYLAYWKNGKDLNIYPINLKHLKDGRVLGESGTYLRDADKIIDNYPIF